MPNLPFTHPQLEVLLRANAKGVYAAEAATELVIAHDRWLRRADFIEACVGHYRCERHQPVLDDTAGWLCVSCGAEAPPEAGPPPALVAAWVDWHQVPGFLEHAVYSGSEGRILRIAAELAGVDSGLPLAELLTALDSTNSRLAIAAIAHARQIPLDISLPGAPPGSEAPDVAQVAKRLWRDLTGLSRALGVVDSGDDRTLDAFNLVYELLHHVADDQVHRGYRERGVCRYCTRGPAAPGETSGETGP